MLEVGDRKVLIQPDGALVAGNLEGMLANYRLVFTVQGEGRVQLHTALSCSPSVA